MVSGADSGRVEELGAQLALLRERIDDIDRAVAALTKVVTDSQHQLPVEKEERDFVDKKSLLELQETVSGQQEKHERMLGTLANMSHEQDINKEHIKVLALALS